MADIFNQYQNAFNDFRIKQATQFKEWRAASSKRSSNDEETINHLIGSGNESDVYKLVDSKHCAKVYKKYTEAKVSQSIENRIRAMHKIEESSISNIAPIKAYDLDSGIVIQELAQGLPIEELDAKDLDQIKGQDFIDLMNTLDSLFSLNIEVDLSPGNIFYNSESGFSLIDFEMNEEFNNEVQSYVKSRKLKSQKEYIVEELESELLDQLTLISTDHEASLEQSFKDAAESFLVKKQ